MWAHYAIAKGKHRFPLDMLRYDHCFPTDSDGVLQLTWKPDKGEEVTIFLTQYSTTENPHWTTKRWASFGWTIKHLRTYKGV